MTLVDSFLVHWNAPDWCNESVASLLASRDVAVRVTVINNGGDLQLPPEVRVVESPYNLGFAGGANLALSQGAARYVLIGCHDVRLEPGGLAALVALLEADPGLAIVGPILNGAGGTEHDLEWISGSAMLMRAEIASAFRFDERFGSYVEDVDLCYRVRDAGWRVGRSGDAHAHTKGSADPEAAFVKMHANTLAWLVMRRQWRAAGSRLKLMVRGALGPEPHESVLFRRALRLAAHQIIRLR